MTPGRAPVVLIAEDNALMRELLAGMLKELGVGEILHAADGDMAVAMYRLWRPDVVFLDIRMPGKDGLAALEAMREMDARAQVVMVSAYGTADHVKTAIAAGAQGFVVKPYTMNRICAVMKRYLPAV